MDNVSLGLLFFVGFLQTCTLGFHSGHFPSLKEVGSVNIEHNLIHERHRRSRDQGEELWKIHTRVSSGNRSVTLQPPRGIYTHVCCGQHGVALHAPREIHTRVTGEVHDVTLRFKPASGQRLRQLVHRNRNGDLVKHLSDKINCTMFYEDIIHGAHALVDICDKGLSMMAELYLDEAHHVILPKEGDARERETTHSLYAVNSSLDYLQDFNVLDDESEKLTPTKKSKFRRKRAATGSYVVELMMIIDYTLYDYWYRTTSASLTDSQRETEALDLIQSYYTFIARGMNFRYRTMTDQSLNIGVELNQINVLQTMEESTLTVDSSHVSGQQDLLDGNTTLYNFIDWVADKRANEPGFPSEDHYMLITDQNLEFGGTTQAAGFAGWKKICTYQSCSVIEGRFNFITAVIAAHELAHSLGGNHDGNTNACSSEDGYILAELNKVKTGTMKYNPFHFSSCSIDSFISTLEAKDSEGTNCLLVDNNPSTMSVVGQPTGQIFLPDEQCKRVFGSGANMWRYNNVFDLKYDQMCTGMACVLPGFQGELMIPADGTSCGSEKWCENGQCVQSVDAPVGIEECLFGDQPQEISTGLTCASVLSIYLGNCYNDNFRVQCCAMCYDMQWDIEDCAYGDKSNCSDIEDYHCYQSNIATACCKRCHDARQKFAHIPNCEYGDHAGNCAPNFCSQFPTQCCGTCFQNDTVQTTTAQTTTTQTTATQTTATQTTATQATATQVSTDSVTVTSTDSSTQVSSQTPAPTVSTPSTQAPVQTSTQAATTKKPEQVDLPDWVIPVAAGSGGLLAVCLIVLLLYLCLRRNPNKARYGRRRSRGSRSRRHSSRGYRDFPPDIHSYYNRYSRY